MGVEFKASSTYSPKSNGVPERMNRTLLGESEAMMKEAGI